MKRTAQLERTDRDIVNAFLELLDEKPFEKIVVADIINKAMINRSTFYAHFSDKYAIVEYLHKKYTDELTEQLDLFISGNAPRVMEIDLIVRNYFVANRPILLKLLRIRTSELDLKTSMNAIINDYIKSLFPSASELEAQMVSDVFIHCLDQDDAEQNFSKKLYEVSIHAALALFGIEPSKANADALADFIVEHR